MSNSRKRVRRQKRSELQVYKAKIRGLIGAAKNANSYATDIHRKKNIFNHGLNDSLIHAREVLSVDEYQDYIGWTEKVTKYSIPKSIDTKTPTLNDLGYISSAKELSFETEIRFLLDRLKQSKPRILQFLKLKAEYENKIWRDDFHSAREVLGEIERDLGWSIWLIETKFAIDQEVGGLEEQKKFLAACRT
ncbi:hypothetical protein [uncultured Marinobacter sp.]|uniref:hypothetical protein n=1 Tax=uncultured Marinobacter sp. TaxID=187379 RepID=UPI002584C7BF|nr:hypothetical protein [uncultured Marinobacter sp.]